VAVYGVDAAGAYEPHGSIKAGLFLKQLSNYQLLEDYASQTAPDETAYLSESVHVFISVVYSTTLSLTRTA
jgi:hypothetical protein